MKNHSYKFLLLAILVYLSVKSCFGFQKIASGTGEWWGEYSLSWGILFAVYILFCIFIVILAGFFLLRREKLQIPIENMVIFRERLASARWLFALFIFILPIWFLQYTSWGFVFRDIYIRMIIWCLVVFWLAFFIQKGNALLGWTELLAAILLTSSGFMVAVALINVTDYPFSLGWSEGNRLWDYSVMFGRNLYIYPADKKIPVLLDFGRSLVGGLPFIFPGITITIARLWVGLIQIIPYLLLGIAIFRKSARNKVLWLLLTLWTFLFLKQGPIHPPLVLSAALVALAWQSPLWCAIPLVVGAGYFVDASRFTWIFAPGIWIFMLELASASFASFSDRKPVSAVWKRAIILGVLGIFGGFVLPNLIGSAGTLMSSPELPIATQVAQAPVAIATDQAQQVAITPTPDPVPSPEVLNPTFFDRVVNIITVQPLLWYRLLPNSTYDNGILLSLLFAVTPLIIILIYLSIKKIWSLDKLQKLVLILPLTAFLVVGLVASTKIGGGGDLHNMDMFLIGLLFTGVLAWHNGGSDWIQDGRAIPSLMKIVIILLLVNSSIGSMFEMRPFDFGEDATRLMTLSDITSKSDLEMLPTQSEIDSALQTIQQEADKAKLQGDVLFLDQRQLLTFDYIKGVPLVPDYEKKVLMNYALSGNAVYFDGFYADLAAHRFSLIISEPLHTPIQDTSFQFGEENNAWVKWVSGPILCYYEPLTTIKTVRVQLLVPSKNKTDCSSILP